MVQNYSFFKKSQKILHKNKHIPPGKGLHKYLQNSLSSKAWKWPKDHGSNGIDADKNILKCKLIMHVFSVSFMKYTLKNAF